MLPQLFNHFLPPAFIWESPSVLVLPMCIFHCVGIFPSFPFCFSVCDFTVWHAHLRHPLIIKARFQKLSLSQLTCNKSAKKTTSEFLHKMWNNLASTVSVNIIRSPLQIHHSKTEQGETGNVKEINLCTLERASNEVVCFQCYSPSVQSE